MSETNIEIMPSQDSRAAVLHRLGPISENAAWHDYLQYGFDEDDVPDLLKLVCDKSLHNAASNTNEIWVPIHAWRTLGQLRSPNAVSTLIVLFDHLPYYDWALKDLGRVMGLVGEPAIDLLAVYMKESRRPDFARAMAFDGLVEIVRNYPRCRTRVLGCFRELVVHLDDSNKSLNGYLVGKLLDLGAVELIDDIRHLFHSGKVDGTCAGGLKEVELELLLRAGRSAHGYGHPDACGYVARKKVGSDESYATIDRYLASYRSESSIASVAGLDGFFAALACAPALIRSAKWMPAVWGGKGMSPGWKSQSESREFKKIVTTLHAAVMASLEKGEYKPLFHEFKASGSTHIFVDEWCTGFMRGLGLWGLLGRVDKSIAQERLKPVLRFGTPKGIHSLHSMDADAINSEQAGIEPAVYDLYRHFREQRRKLYDDFVHNTAQAGRDDPCPCGSGRVYKHCCLRS